jgi:hypothetical protein
MAMASSIPNYVSDSKDDIAIDNGVARSIQRKEKRTRSWVMENAYSNQQGAMDFINSEETWSFHFKNSTQDGKKAYFRCNKAKLRAKQCPAGIYLLYDCRSEEHLLKSTLFP